MTFFYDLNKRLANLASKQDAKQIAEDAKASAPKSKLAESLDVAEAGYSAKAGRAGKDLGKPGKNFSKIAKSAGEKYGSKAAGERVAGAVLNKLRHPTNEGACPTCGCSPCKCDSMEESALQAYLGNKKYGKDGMDALRKAGREHASKSKMDQIRNRYDKMDEADMEEGNAFTAALQATPKGGKFKVGGKEFTDTSSIEETGGIPMTPKQKSFAKLAPPADKITFADKIAGAKKEVDEMLGDVAAEAMRKAVVGHAGEEEMDEGYAEMDAWMKSREKEKGTGKFDKKERTLPSGMKATTYTRRHEEEPEDDSDAPVSKGGAPKKKGRPAGTRRAIGAKHSGRSKLASKDAIAEEGSTPQEQAYSEIVKLLKNPESGIDSSIRNRLMRLVRTLNVSEPVAEKAASVAQRRAAGIAHAAQKGEIPKSELRGASKEMAKMPKGELHKFAATKEKDLPKKVKEEGKPDFVDLDKDGDKTEPMKKAAKQAKEKGKDKEEKVDETTTSGSVATAPATPKSSKGMQFGKGVYEGLSSKLENMIAESMNITVNMSTDEQGQAQKSITVTATDEDADKLAELLKMAGLGGQSEACSACGSADCQCGAEMVDENSPDWPTNTEKLDAQPELRTYSGGLNGPKSTGQSTTPVLASQLRRQTSMEEGVKLERSLFNTWKNYKG
jgi:hypothetical protein